MDAQHTDVLIIGAGPSGCVAAAHLFRNGLSVRIVEKSKFPRFVIGESLIPRCMDHFDTVGLLDCLKARDFEVKTGARFMKKGVVCEFDFSKKHTDGWDWTWQVPRADFDMALTDELQRWGLPVDFEHEVTDVVFNGSSSVTSIRDKNGRTGTIHAKFIVDCSGYGRVLPRLLGLDKPSSIPDHSSIFTHVRDVRRPEGWEGHRITFDIVRDDTWLWVIPFSNGMTSLGFVGPTAYLESYKGSNTDKMRELMELSPHYRERFRDLTYDFEPRMVMNIAKSVTRLYGEGFALTGNSAEFLDPVFSSGVAFATESGYRAAELVARQLSGEPVDWESEYSDYILQGVEVFGTYVKEWYTGNLQKIFFHHSENPVIKSQICAVLAGYVWDQSNPFVKNHDRLVRTVARITDMEREAT